MRALSLHQPWAWAVLNGKNIENRRWNTSIRGRFLIHAAKSWSEADAARAYAFCAVRGLHVPMRDGLQFGGIIGSAVLVDVLPRKLENEGWQMAGQFGFVLEDVRALPFVPLRGLQRWFEVPDELLRGAA